MAGTTGHTEQHSFQLFYNVCLMFVSLLVYGEQTCGDEHLDLYFQKGSFEVLDKEEE